MKFSKLSQVTGAGIVAFGLANLISILPASAQTNPSDGSSTDTTTDSSGTLNKTGSTMTDYRDNHFDWGWLGLIGLAGLAGLGNKNRHENVGTYRDPNVR